MPNTTPKTTRARTLAALQALISGLQKQFPGGKFTLANVELTTVALVTLFQSAIDALNALAPAEAAYDAALANARAVMANVGPVTLDLKHMLLTMYSNAPQTLGLFGLTPPKAKAPRTAQQKAVAVAKAKATREARGTTSAKAKAAIKGNVTGLQVTPITVSASPEPVPSAQPPAVTPSAPTPGTSGK